MTKTIEMKKNLLNTVLDDIKTFSDLYKLSTKDSSYYENIVSVLTDEKHRIEAEIMAEIDKEEATPERRIFHIDVGNMPNHLATAFVEHVKDEKHRIEAEIMAAIDKEEAAPEHKREIIICEDELHRLVVAFSAFKLRIGDIGLKDIGLFQLFEEDNSIFVQFPDRSIVDLSDNEAW